MQERAGWLPGDVDLEKPSAARCYDYFLGGSYNFESDRELGRRVEQAVPNIRDTAYNNRSYLRRIVRFCLSQGIRQFIDIGSGLPTVGNVHEIAQQVDPQAPVVYVDHEPVAVTHSLHMLEGNEFASMVHADVIYTNDVLDAPETRRLIDFSQPVAVLMVALLHFISDDQGPKEIIKRFYERMAPGSLLAISHGASDVYPEIALPIVDLYRDSEPVSLRSREQVSELMSDFDMVEPGVVFVPEWRPETDEDRWPEPAKSILYAAAGRKMRSSA